MKPSAVVDPRVIHCGDNIGRPGSARRSLVVGGFSVRHLPG